MQHVVAYDQSSFSSLFLITHTTAFVVCSCIKTLSSALTGYLFFHPSFFLSADMVGHCACSFFLHVSHYLLIVGHCAYSLFSEFLSLLKVGGCSLFVRVSLCLLRNNIYILLCQCIVHYRHRHYFFFSGCVAFASFFFYYAR